MKTRRLPQMAFFLICRPAGLVTGLLAGLFLPVHSQADGCFVAPPFVWNKHKDINEPTQKAIVVYDAGREDLILQVKYNGPVQEFGWLVPVPGQPTVQRGSMASFYALSRYTQEKWEPRFYAGNRSKGEDENAALSTLSAGGAQPEPVKVIEIKTVGAYEVAVLSATEPGSLEKWLAANQFAYPKDKAAVLDDYVRQHWYFVAVKIDLRQTGGFQMAGTPRQAKRPGVSVAEKLAEGELQPLQISFASDQCVFPLKISSVNGTPSEVQVYVLSPEPLVEQRMFEKKFPEVRRLALEQNANRIKMQQRSLEMRQAMMKRYAPEATAEMAFPVETNLSLNQIFKMSVPYDALLHYAIVTGKDLPDSHLPRFKGKKWWLTKQTWTFKPEEMQDLVFQPAAAAFAGDLGDEMGYYVAQNLTRLGTNAVPVLLQALQSNNPSVRIHAASVLDRDYIDDSLAQDSRVAAFLPALFNDPEWEVRMDAAQAAGEVWQSEFAGPLIQLLQDKNEAVQHTAVFALKRNAEGRQGHIPELLKLLKAENLKVRANALEVLSSSLASIPREDVLPLLGVPDMRVLDVVVRRLEQDGVSDDELLPLLHSSYVPAGLLWLRTRRDFEDKASIADVIPLLRDPEPMVRSRAGELLMYFTGQQIPKDQPDQWAQWWDGHKITVMIAEYTDRIADDPTNGESYHDRGCYNYDARNFTQALADFRRACKWGSETPDYSHYRVWLLRARAGEVEAATHELKTYLKFRKTGRPDDWPSKIGRFLTGQLSENDFLHAARDPKPKTDREQLCEAWFYAGSKRLIAGDKVAAADYFQKCLATGVKDFQEYESAGTELKLLPHPGP